MRNRKQLKTPVNKADRFMVQRYVKSYVNVLHQSPPWESAKSMVQTVFSKKKEKRKIKISKIENFRKNDCMDVLTENIW